MDKEEVSEDYKLVKVPTGEALAIQTPEGEYISTELALVEVLNMLKQVQTAVA